MPVVLFNLPDDNEALRAMVAVLLDERDDLHIENLRLQVELARYRKWYYGPRADRLQSEGDLAQMLLSFAEALDRKPVNLEDVPPRSEPQEELRRVRRRKGRRRVQDFENLPVTTQLHEPSPEERICCTIARLPCICSLFSCKPLAKPLSTPEP